MRPEPYPTFRESCSYRPFVGRTSLLRQVAKTPQNGGECPKYCPKSPTYPHESNKNGHIVPTEQLRIVQLLFSGIILPPSKSTLRFDRIRRLGRPYSSR